MRRFSLLVLPFLAAFAMIFGLYHLYAALQLLRSGYVVRGALVCGFDAGWALMALMAAVTILTLASVAVYLREWVRHMGVA